jgi:hypothetical protein
VAVTLDKSQLAVEWIEQSRSIVWRQLLQLRSPQEGLEHIDAELAKRLDNISKALEHSSTIEYIAKTSATKEGNPLEERHSLETQAQLHRQLAKDSEDLVKQCRMSPGFEISFVRILSALFVMQPVSERSLSYIPTLTALMLL